MGFSLKKIVAPLTAMVNPVAALGTALSVGADVYSAKEQARAAEQANRTNIDLSHEQMNFSAAQAQKQMDFQKEMSGSSYQRAVEDMKKAGINPMLAVSNGGASSPSGAMGSYSTPDVKPIPSVVANSISGAMDMVRTYADVSKSIADADASRSSAKLARANVPKAQADTEKTKADTEASKFEQRTFKLFNDLFDRIKGSYDSSAKGAKLFPFIRKGESGVDFQLNPFTR